MELPLDEIEADIKKYGKSTIVGEHALALLSEVKKKEFSLTTLECYVAYKALLLWRRVIQERINVVEEPARASLVKSLAEADPLIKKIAKQYGWDD